MLRIVKHIKSLLSEHDCVIIPDFGGFVLQDVATHIETNTHLFIPSYKEIVFNETLRYNDGVLIGSYMKSERCDYPAARELVQGDVRSLKESLRNERMVSFEKIGSFIIGEENQLIFQSGDQEWLNADNYGLSEFTFEPLPRQIPENHPTKERDARKEVYYIPISRQFLRLAVASIIAIVLFLSTSLSVKEISPTAYTASFIPVDMTQPSTWQRNNPSSPTESSEGITMLNIGKEAQAETAKASLHNKDIPSRTHMPSSEKKAQAKTDKKYNVIIGSFPTQEQAEKYLKETGRDVCPHMDILFNNGKYRAYAECFDNRADAEKYMAGLRENTKHKDAWLFICR